MADWFYGKEGQQYGPIDEPTLRARIATGEIAPADLIWTEGMAQWTPLREVSQFSTSPTAPSLGEVAPIPPADPAASPYTTPQTNPVSVAPAFPMTQQTSGLAIASLVCGILGVLTCFCGVLGIPAVICGHMAMKQTGPLNPTPMQGRGMAIAGLVCGYISIAFLIVFMLIGIFDEYQSH